MTVRRDKKPRAAPNLRDLLAALEASPDAAPLPTAPAGSLPEMPVANAFSTAPIDDYASQPSPARALWPPADHPDAPVSIPLQASRDAEHLPTPLHTAAPVAWPPPASREAHMPPLETSTPIPFDWGSSSGDVRDTPAASFPPMSNLRPAVEPPDARGPNRGLIASFGIIMILAAASGGAALFWQTAGSEPAIAPVTAAASQVRTDDTIKTVTANSLANARSIAEVASLGPSPAPLPAQQVPEIRAPVPLSPVATAPVASAPAIEPSPVAVPESRKGEDEERAQKYLRRGQQLLTEGDVAAARTFFGMSAEAGDAEAAMAMGATYDPNHLLQFGVRGMRPDPNEAIRWYQLAINLGSKDALDRIEALRGKK